MSETISTPTLKSLLGVPTTEGLIKIAREVAEKALSDGPYKELVTMLADACEQLQTRVAELEAVYKRLDEAYETDC